MENWQFASGTFYPRSPKFGKAFYLSGDISETLDKLFDYIVHQKGKVVCVNDGAMSDEDIIRAKEKTHIAFDLILPDKSKFEK